MTAARYGPIRLLAAWEAACPHPVYLVTNLSDLEAAGAHCQQRAQSETFFSDQKSRGFHPHRSHPRAPARLGRGLLAARPASPWLVYFGVRAVQDERPTALQRRHRRDLRPCRLGRRLLARCLKEALPIPDGFLVPAVMPPFPHSTDQARAA